MKKHKCIQGFVCCFVFLLFMTWAYACNATHPGFATYGKNQVKMYQAILQAVHQATADNHIDRIIPSGIAIQRARAVLGDTLNRDGYHLSYTVGRYTAACTWCEFLTGKSVVGNTYRPSSVSATDAMIAQYAAHQAMALAPQSVLSCEGYLLMVLAVDIFWYTLL